MSHFTVYGASYYSYVYARFLSAAVWNKFFEGQPMNSEAGRAVWDGLLRPGGAIEPVDLVQGLLGPESLHRSASRGFAPKPDDPTIQRARLSF